QTDRITLNSSYVVLKPGATHTIQASVSPSSAPQALTYTSMDSKVATVTSSGVIRAVSAGSTTVTVSNGATKAAITVIVNQGTASSGDTGEDTTPTEPEQTDVDALVEQIKSAADGAVIEARLSVVPAAVLNALSGTDKALTVPQDGYSLTIRGRDIKNASNELDTRLAFAETEDGLEFTLNGGGYMPGEVEVTLDETTAAAYRYLYLYNSTTEEWQQLNTYENGVLTLDTAGRYLLRSEVFRTWGLGWWFVGTVSVLVVVLAVIYIGFKRRYWFW
ncbi:MAG: Ig-like domain-containing protein, partial [Sutterellaceae bacterium]|nr:Ig-like domain-containing protein [Sutterellaceae bacterium]